MATEAETVPMDLTHIRATLTREWQQFRNLPGRFVEYETLYFNGEAEMRVEPIMDGQHIRGSRTFFRLSA